MKVVICALLIGVAAGHLGAVSIADESRSSKAPSAGRPAALSVNEAPAPERPVPTDPRELEIAYAEVLLKLAKLDLQKMIDLQNRVRGSITATQFDRVEGLARVAEETFRLAKEGKATRSAINLVRAREALRTAEMVWKTAQQVKAAANAISDIELARLRMMVEVERLSLARAEAAAATESPLDDLAWENDQLRDDMQRLRYRFEALTARR
jgi:hypothetical protein